MEKLVTNDKSFIDQLKFCKNCKYVSFNQITCHINCNHPSNIEKVYFYDFYNYEEHTKYKKQICNLNTGNCPNWEETKREKMADKKERYFMVLVEDFEQDSYVQETHMLNEEEIQKYRGKKDWKGRPSMIVEIIEEN